MPTCIGLHTNTQAYTLMVTAVLQTWLCSVCAGPSLVLAPPPASPEPPPLESRIRQDKSDFQEQQRQRVAQEVRNERRHKKQVSATTPGVESRLASLLLTGSEAAGGPLCNVTPPPSEGV